MRIGNRDKVAKDTEVAGSTSKCDRYMVEKSTHLNREISHAVAQIFTLTRSADVYIAINNKRLADFGLISC